MLGGIAVQSTTTMAEAIQQLGSDSKQRGKLGELSFSTIQNVYNKDKTTSAWIKLVEALASDYFLNVVIWIFPKPSNFFITVCEAVCLWRNPESLDS